MLPRRAEPASQSVHPIPRRAEPTPQSAHPLPRRAEAGEEQAKIEKLSVIRFFNAKTLDTTPFIA